MGSRLADRSDVASAIGLRGLVEVAYRLMLRRPRWRAASLSEALAVSETEAEELLDELGREGLVVRSADDDQAVRAVEPCLALPALVTRRLRASTGETEVPRATAVAKFVSLHERAAERPGELADATGMDDVTALIERLAATVRTEMVLLTPSWLPGAFEFMPHVVEAVLRRGATLRQVWSSSVLDSPEAVEHARWLGSWQVAPRTVAHVPKRVVVMDGSVAVLLDAPGRIRVLRGEATPGFDNLVQMADQLWERSVEIRQASWPLRLVPSRARHEQVLRLLAEGLTDEAIARRIGVSVRTVRNDVASTMVGLEARSRFQAGVRAAQMGLI
jgi:DNA-binding CsgD family transcriptional regulator